VFDTIVDYADAWIFQITQLFPAGTLPSYAHNITAILAVIFVCAICGAMGALVVGNRMAFFSDALAHCAFAGVGLGIAAAVALGTGKALFHTQLVGVMIIFGIIMGLLIAFVRERTGLASDTVIGVFYAGAVGVGAVLVGLVRDPDLFSLEGFIFGDPLTAPTGQVLCLGVLAVVVALFLWWMNNYLVLASASSSLAISRRVPVRWCNYALIVTLAVIVNLSLQIVGALLINGMLIVPAAAAANVARNLRQMFWYSLLFALVSGCTGYVVSWEMSMRLYPRHSIGTVGAIVMVAVILFIGTMLIARRLRDRPTGMDAVEQDDA
jgi:zinc transport system permease protein